MYFLSYFCVYLLSNPGLKPFYAKWRFMVHFICVNEKNNFQYILQLTYEI